MVVGHDNQCIVSDTQVIFYSYLRTVTNFLNKIQILCRNFELKILIHSQK